MLQQPPIFHNGTTRCFPRTLDQAFNHGADYGCSIVRYRNPNFGFWIGAICAVLALFVVASWI